MSCYIGAHVVNDEKVLTTIALSSCMKENQFLLLIPEHKTRNKNEIRKPLDLIISSHKSDLTMVKLVVLKLNTRCYTEAHVVMRR
jgi:hypothetical protein